MQKLLRRGDGGRRERRQGSHDRAHRRQGSHTRAHLAAGSHDVIPSVGTVYIEPGRGRSGPPVSTDSTGEAGGGSAWREGLASLAGKPPGEAPIASPSVRNLRSTFTRHTD